MENSASAALFMGPAIGAVAGLIVSSWQGYKDPPWEGFFVGKFLRSILVGAAVGLCLLLADSAGVFKVDNYGILGFAIVALERVIGEAYKGFFRRSAHAEYFRLLHRIGIPGEVYVAKLLAGIGFIVAAWWLFRFLAR